MNNSCSDTNESTPLHRRGPRCRERARDARNARGRKAHARRSPPVSKWPAAFPRHPALGRDAAVGGREGRPAESRGAGAADRKHQRGFVGCGLRPDARWRADVADALLLSRRTDGKTVCRNRRAAQRHEPCRDRHAISRHQHAISTRGGEDVCTGNLRPHEPVPDDRRLVPFSPQRSRGAGREQREFHAGVESHDAHMERPRDRACGAAA